MRITIHIISSFIGVLLCACVLYAADEQTQAGVPSIIDIPTSYATAYGDYRTEFRFYTGGGILTDVVFGVFNKVNIGFSWDLESVIGSETINVNEPTLNLKIRFWDGSIIFPALAFGYDGQGYFYDDERDEYIQREKGVFLTATKELLVPKLEWTVGANIFDFSEDVINGFAGVTYTIHPCVLMVEYDNIHYIDYNRLNAGLRILIHSTISVDLAGRDLGTADRDAERIIRINYRGTF